jgi:hypothetical protein
MTEEEIGLRNKMGCFGSTAGLVAIGVVVLLVVVAIWQFSSFNGIKNTGVAKESALNAQYLDNQNELSKVTLQIKESLGVADLKSQKLDEVLTDAVKGRYDGDLQAATPGQAPQLISALVEAYPDMSGLATYDRVVDIIQAGRESYANKQSKLLDMLRDYDTWRRSGIINSWKVSLAGFPSDGLEARIGTKIERGQDALDQMYLIVLVEGTTEAYETGVIEPVIGEEPK